MGQIRPMSPNFKARSAGAFYVLSVAVAVMAEFFVRGGFGLIGVFVPVLAYAAVTVLLYQIFRPVQRTIALIAAACGLVGLVFETLRWLPRHGSVAMVLHGGYCLLIGWLMVRSDLLPRVLGALMIFAGLIWLIDLSPLLVRELSPYNTALGLFGEGLPMLWLLGMGIRTERRKLAVAAAQECL